MGASVEDIKELIKNHYIKGVPATPEELYDIYHVSNEGLLIDIFRLLELME